MRHLYRFERGGWLAAFVALSLLLHTAALYGSRGWRLLSPPGPPAPKPAEIEVALSPPASPSAAAPPAGEPKPAPLPKEKPAHNDVPVPFRPHEKVLRGVAPKPAPKPVSRTDRSSADALDKPLPVPSARVPQVAGGKIPDADLKPLPLGVETGDRMLTPKPVEKTAKQPDQTMMEPRPAAETPTAVAGSGSGPVIPNDAPVRDPEPLVTGDGGAASGQGAPTGHTTGFGADAGGVGLTRGVPFGDPGGVLRGGDPNGGGGTGGGPGGPGRGSAYGGGGGAGAPVRVVYLVDISESMGDGDKIGKARAALRQALADLSPEDAFDIVYFADDQHVFSPRSLVPATRENVAKAGRYLANLKPRGSTNLSDALGIAFKLPGVTHVVLISDGEPTLGVGTELDEKNQEVIIDDDQLLDWIRRRNRLSRIHILTIDLGLGDDFEGRDLLQAIADQNDGAFAAIDLSAQQ